MKKFNLLNIFAISLLFLACSEQGRESEIYKRLNDDVNKASDSLLAIVDFRKTNGKELVEGTTKYELDFEGFISPRKDCCWTGSPVKLASAAEIARGVDKTSYPLKFNVKECSDTTGTDFAKVGWGYKVVGKAFFEKTDNGWRLLDYTLIDSTQIEKLPYLKGN